MPRRKEARKQQHSSASRWQIQQDGILGDTAGAEPFLAFQHNVGSRSKRPKASLNWVISAPSIFILHIMLLSFQGFKITSLIICSKIKLKRKSKRNKIYITKRTTFPKVIICIFFLSNFSRNMLKPQQQKGVSNVTFCWQGRFSQLSNRVSYDFQCTVIHTVSLSL